MSVKYYVQSIHSQYKGDELRVTVNKLTDEITMQSIEKSPLKKATGIPLEKDIIHDYKVKADTVMKSLTNSSRTR